MQNALKNVMGEKIDEIVIKELFNSLDKLRLKGKEIRMKVILIDQSNNISIQE